MKFAIAAAVCVLLSASETLADGPPGYTLGFSDDLTTSRSEGWHENHGWWEVVDGGYRAAMVPEDLHPAASRYRFGKDFNDVVWEFDFRFDGATRVALSINDLEVHVCHAIIRPIDLAVQKDDQDTRGPDKVVELDRKKLQLAPREWHHARVEIRGDTLKATVGDVTVEGQHQAIGVPKENFALIVSGKTASFRRFRMWVKNP